MGYQIRTSLTISFAVDLPLWYMSKLGAIPEGARYLMQSDRNTSLVVKNDRTVLVYNDPIRKCAEEDAQSRVQESTKMLEVALLGNQKLKSVANHKMI
ncbi:Hypothetical predicted protein [Octopus vulgaris]|uniref:Uncharacterized protein n=1 Tax=Octopus vulgaris TaxID=6645 RepID=A0AA36F751_OCTVU|nr:Hypothetical predicted protein [Octopus vulgaris]